MSYGMASMTHRTTFALDEATVTRIRRLAVQWQVSQAEVIRRVVASTDETVNSHPVAMLSALHRTGGGAHDLFRHQLPASRLGRGQSRGSVVGGVDCGR
jgi:hypothetical protein